VKESIGKVQAMIEPALTLRARRHSRLGDAVGPRAGVRHDLEMKF